MEAEGRASTPDVVKGMRRSAATPFLPGPTVSKAGAIPSVEANAVDTLSWMAVACPATSRRAPQLPRIQPDWDEALA